MIKMSKKGDYGLILLTALAKNGDRHYQPLQQIALKNNLPYKFISQIALDLKQAGIIGSKEGLGGGYKLAKPAKSINLAQVVEILEGPIHPVACMRGGECSCAKACEHKMVMNHVAQVLVKTLKHYSLQDIAKKGSAV